MIAVDRDPRAIAEAHKIQDLRFQIEHNSFSHIPEICDKLNLVGKIDGILLDLGVSSPQLDEAERGFSFMKKWHRIFIAYQSIGGTYFTGSSF